MYVHYDRMEKASQPQTDNLIVCVYYLLTDFEKENKVTTTR